MVLNKGCLFTAAFLGGFYFIHRGFPYRGFYWLILYPTPLLISRAYIRGLFPTSLYKCLYLLLLSQPLPTPLPFKQKRKPAGDNPYGLLREKTRKPYSTSSKRPLLSHSSDTAERMSTSSHRNSKEKFTPFFVNPV